MTVDAGMLSLVLSSRNLKVDRGLMRMSAHWLVLGICIIVSFFAKTFFSDEK